MDASLGPYNLEHTQAVKGIAFKESNLFWTEEKPDHEALAVLENYEGINLIEKVTTYFVNKGNAHNNPIMGTYNPKTETHQRLIFFQANNRADKVYATAVFSGGAKKDIPKDTELCNYLATQIGKRIQKKLGKLYLYYAPFAD